MQLEAELRQHREEEARHNRQMRSYLMTTLALISLGACATGVPRCRFLRCNCLQRRFAVSALVCNACFDGDVLLNLPWRTAAM